MHTKRKLNRIYEKYTIENILHCIKIGKGRFLYFKIDLKLRNNHIIHF